MIVIIAGPASHGHILTEITKLILKNHIVIKRKFRMIAIVADSASDGHILAEITILIYKDKHIVIKSIQTDIYHCWFY